MEQGKRGGGEDGVREVHLKKKKCGEQHVQMHRWGVGGEAKTEGKELSPITWSQTIFLPLKKSPLSWWDTADSQPAILLSHGSKRSELKARVQPSDGDLIHNALTSWLMTLWPALRRKKICSNKRLFNVREQALQEKNQTNQKKPQNPTRIWN